MNNKHGVKRKIKTAYDNYLLDILGLEGDTGKENQVFSGKKLFSFLKSSKTDAQGIGVLKKDGKVCTNDVDQANLLSSQFHSVLSVRPGTSQPYETLSYDQVEWCFLPC